MCSNCFWYFESGGWVGDRRKRSNHSVILTEKAASELVRWPPSEGGFIRHTSLLRVRLFVNMPVRYYCVRI